MGRSRANLCRKGTLSQTGRKPWVRTIYKDFEEKEKPLYTDPDSYVDLDASVSASLLFFISWICRF